jgi:hypothetical protein
MSAGNSDVTYREVDFKVDMYDLGPAIDLAIGEDVEPNGVPYFDTSNNLVIPLIVTRG